MRRRKALSVALSLMAVCALAVVLVLLYAPTPAASHSNYTYKPGCHCGAPKTTTTTKKPTTTTTKRPTTTTKKPTATTKTTTKKPTTTNTSAQATTTSASTTTTLPELSSSAAGPTFMYFGSSYDPDIERAAQTILSGLALAAVGGPPDDSGTGGGAGAGGATSGEIAGSTDPSAGQSNSSATGDPAAVEADTAGPPVAMPHYYVSPVAIIFLLVYGATFWLYQTGRMRVATHRRIWNVLLMITFLFTGLFGVVLAIGISLNPPMELPSWLLFWHVETGIVMCFISLFHLAWHARYYASTLTFRRKNGPEPVIPGVAPYRGGPSRPAFDYLDEVSQIRPVDEHSSRGSRRGR